MLLPQFECTEMDKVGPLGDYEVRVISMTDLVMYLVCRLLLSLPRLAFYSCFA